MEKQKPFYLDFIKKDADLTFRSVFDFVNCKDFTSFMLECQSKRCNVLFYDENIFLISGKKALPKHLSGK